MIGHTHDISLSAIYREPFVASSQLRFTKWSGEPANCGEASRGEAHGEAFYLHSTLPPYNPFFSDHPAGARKGILVRDIAARRGQIQKSESRTAA